MGFELIGGMEFYEIFFTFLLFLFIQLKLSDHDYLL